MDSCTSGGSIFPTNVPYFVFYCNSTVQSATVIVTALSATGIDICEVEAFGKQLLASGE